MDEQLEGWRRAGFMVVLSGMPGPRTGTLWVCSIFLTDPDDTATGANDSLIEAINITDRLARRKWPQGEKD